MKRCIRLTRSFLYDSHFLHLRGKDRMKLKTKESCPKPQKNWNIVVSLSLSLAGQSRGFVRCTTKLKCCDVLKQGMDAVWRWRKWHAWPDENDKEHDLDDRRTHVALSGTLFLQQMVFAARLACADCCFPYTGFIPKI